MPHMAPVVAASLITGGTALGGGLLSAKSQSSASKRQAEADALALAEAQRERDYQRTVDEDKTRYDRAQSERADYVSQQGDYQHSLNRAPIVNDFYDRMGYQRPEVVNLNEIARGFKPSPYTPAAPPPGVMPPPEINRSGGWTRNALLAGGVGLGGLALGKYLGGKKSPSNGFRMGA